MNLRPLLLFPVLFSLLGLATTASAQKTAYLLPGCDAKGRPMAIGQKSPADTSADGGCRQWYAPADVSGILKAVVYVHASTPDSVIDRMGEYSGLHQVLFYNMDSVGRKSERLMGLLADLPCLSEMTYVQGKGAVGRGPKARMPRTLGKSKSLRTLYLDIRSIDKMADLSGLENLDNLYVYARASLSLGRGLEGLGTLNELTLHADSPITFPVLGGLPKQVRNLVVTSGTGDAGRYILPAENFPQALSLVDSLRNFTLGSPMAGLPSAPPGRLSKLARLPEVDCSRMKGKPDLRGMDQLKDLSLCNINGYLDLGNLPDGDSLRFMKMHFAYCPSGGDLARMLDQVSQVKALQHVTISIPASLNLSASDEKALAASIGKLRKVSVSCQSQRQVRQLKEIFPKLEVRYVSAS